MTAEKEGIIMFHDMFDGLVIIHTTSLNKKESRELAKLVAAHHAWVKQYNDCIVIFVLDEYTHLDFYGWHIRNERYY